MGRDIHFCKCGLEIFDEMETCSDCSRSRAAAGYRAREWARNNTVWRQLEDGRICVRPKDLMAVVDECNRYRKALEEIAGNESCVNAERADGIAITALAFENSKVSHE